MHKKHNNQLSLPQASGSLLKRNEKNHEGAHEQGKTTNRHETPRSKRTIGSISQRGMGVKVLLLSKNLHPRSRCNSFPNSPCPNRPGLMKSILQFKHPKLLFFFFLSTSTGLYIGISLPNKIGNIAKF